MGYKDTFIAVIDIGSNGIRLSINKKLDRHLCVDYEYRIPISLFDAQNNQGDGESCTRSREIPVTVMDEIIFEFLRFKDTLDKLSGETLVQVVATESFRTASNADEFQKKIQEEVGWTVKILSKLEEANMTSLGVVSSFFGVDGLIMDLGGGSVEFNLVRQEAGQVSIQESPEPQSFPFGAALLRDQLKEVDATEIQANMTQQISEVLPKLKVETNLVKCLYWSGGGFRAIGYAVMHHFLKPISIINGFRASREEVLTIIQKYGNISTQEIEKEDIFRVGKKRSQMLKGCCLLAWVILQVFNQVDSIYFSGGGVRQGVMYSLLEPIQKEQDPLISGIRELLLNKPCLPMVDIESLIRLLSPLIDIEGFSSKNSGLSCRILEAAVYTSQLYMHHSVESRALCAMQLPLAGGDLANLPGLLHPERACLSLILLNRYGGDVKTTDLKPIKDFLPKETVKLCKLIGKMLELCIYLVPVANTLNNTDDISGSSLLKDASIRIQSNHQENTHRIQLKLPSTLKGSNTFVFRQLLKSINNKHFQVTVEYLD